MVNEKYLTLLKQHLGLILFIVACVISLIGFQEYGIAWDELVQRKTGLINFDYIFHGNKYLLEWKDRYYGVAFELPLILIEKLLNLTDTRDIYLTRHLLTHLFFLIGALFCFKLIDLLYENKTMATIGFLLITINPGLYAHSFFNTKDIPFMSMFIICLYFNASAFRKKTVLNFIVLGISIGLLINLRIMGVLLPCIVFLFLLIDGIREKSYLKHGLLIICFFTSAAIVLYATWPYLWTNPIENFITAFQNMSKFPWDDTVLFKGQLIKATELGWDYIPVWFSITTPLLYLLIGFFGISLLIIKISKKPLDYLENLKGRNNLFFLFCLFAPLIAVILLHSVLYDGWRQMFFIYPSFVMLVIFGLHSLFKTKIKNLTIASFIIAFISISTFMIVNFPFQQVYFNSIVSFCPPESTRKNFDLDYWGTSYKQSLEYILEHDSSSTINICVANKPGEFNINILHPDQRIRIRYVPFDNATYFITNYRWHPSDYENLNKYKYHSFQVSDNTINEIFKLK